MLTVNADLSWCSRVRTSTKNSWFLSHQAILLHGLLSKLTPLAALQPSYRCFMTQFFFFELSNFPVAPSSM
jgi:hypothetical protein